MKDFGEFEELWETALKEQAEARIRERWQAAHPGVKLEEVVEDYVMVHRLPMEMLREYHRWLEGGSLA